MPLEKTGNLIPPPAELWKHHTQTHTHKQAHTQAHTHRHTQTHRHTHTHKHRHAHTHTHKQTHTDTIRHTQTHTHTHTPNRTKNPKWKQHTPTTQDTHPHTHLRTRTVQESAPSQDPILNQQHALNNPASHMPRRSTTQPIEQPRNTLPLIPLQPSHQPFLPHTHKPVQVHTQTSF